MLGDVVIDGHPVFAVLDRTPDQLETVLAAAARVARGNPRVAAKAGPRDPAAAALALRVRRRLRSLAETRLAYRMRMRSLVLAVRLKDHSFERVMAPSPEGPFLPRSPLLKDLIDQEAEILRIQNDLVALWAAFQGEAPGALPRPGHAAVQRLEIVLRTALRPAGRGRAGSALPPDGVPAPAPGPPPPPPAPPAPPAPRWRSSFSGTDGRCRFHGDDHLRQA